MNALPRSGENAGTTGRDRAPFQCPPGCLASLPAAFGRSHAAHNLEGNSEGVPGLFGRKSLLCPIATRKEPRWFRVLRMLRRSADRNEGPAETRDEPRRSIGRGCEPEKK